MLIIYPTTDYDSFVSVVDADTIISKNSLKNTEWTALTEAQKEVFLRIATTRILNAIDTSLLVEDVCIKNATALMAVRDLVFEISSSVNPNTGLISKEKVGNVEVTYFHGNPIHRITGRSTNPFPKEIIPCLQKYGADLTSGYIQKATLVHS